MRSTWYSRAGRKVLGATLFLAVTVMPAVAKPRPGLPAKRTGLNLFALTNGLFNSNRIFCGITNRGTVCVDITGSPVAEGGFWPKGTADNYIFNSGLQLAGTIPANAGFQWAGDTVGAYFMDPRGDQQEGDPITSVYNSIDPGDAVNWPNGGVVRDSTVYNKVLLGRNVVSQQDMWVRSWDGNPAFTGSARTHPMGILVEERGMAWNYPTGNEDILYFVYTFYNVTAKDPAVYSRLDPAIQGEIAAVGAQFQATNNAAYGITIPAAGYPITNMFVAMFEDPDVGNASFNYSTPVIPFNMGVAYKSDFLEPTWAPFDPSIFGAPFAAAPGFTALKYLKSPVDSVGHQIGLTLWSNTLNSGSGYPDPVGVKQLYRYIGGTSDPSQGDFPCTIQGQQKLLHFCFQAQQPADTRDFQASGPLTLNPGDQQTIVIAYIQAAAVATPFLVSNIGNLAAFAPGVPASGDSIAANPSRVRNIERVMGWVSDSDLNHDGSIEQNEVTTFPRSLLNKALVAQAVYDNKFLLPFSPDSPQFFLIPGNNKVTVVWQKSGSETVKAGGGNPFYAVASDPTSALYDPNFRQYDVEGYRVYRGRTSGALQLVAQFDYSGTFMTDYTGTFAYANCAPELGVQTGCPVTFPQPVTPGSGNPISLAGDVVQVPAGGRVKLADGSILILKADSAVAGGGSGFPKLADTGVAFAFDDFGVRNSFTYFYSVTAFSVNSLNSGPSSLESPRITKMVVPQGSSNQTIAGKLGTLTLQGAGGTPLSGSLPTLDATTGEFSGPFPPTDGVGLGLASFLPDLLGSNGSIALTVDSILPGEALLSGTAAKYYVSAKGSGAPVQVVIPLPVDATSADASASANFPATNINQAQSVRFGGDSSYALFGNATVSASGTWRHNSWGRGSINSDPSNSDFNGPRWWSGTPNENTADPNSSHCSPAAGACVQAPLTKTAGALPGVDTIFHVQSYVTVPNVPERILEGVTSGVTRAADFKVFWGTNGAIDSVVDVTHHVPVPFSTKIRASWGILTDSSFVIGGTNAATTADGKNNLLTWSDIFCVDPIPSAINDCGGAAQSPAVLQNHAHLSPIAAHSATYAGTNALAAGGNGFIFYLNGHFFLMQMAALPAAGTVWNARFYSGSITGTTGSYAFTPAILPPAVPGLQASISYTGSNFDPTKTTAADLSLVHTVPDPYYVTNALEATANTKILKFVHLPAQAIVRIYSLSGVLVQVLTHNDPAGGGEMSWNLRNRNQQFVASGVYFYHVETPDGKSKVGRFTVVNFAP